MKILDQNEKYGDHVNFIDSNDVFVGYDLGQTCCETADWYIADKIIPYQYDFRNGSKLPDETPNVSEYCFDPDFFQQVESENLDAGDMVVFKLIANNKPNLYLHLYNCHNGYYEHGFKVKYGDAVVREGCL